MSEGMASNLLPRSLACAPPLFASSRGGNDFGARLGREPLVCPSTVVYERTNNSLEEQRNGRVVTRGQSARSAPTSDTESTSLLCCTSYSASVHVHGRPKLKSFLPTRVMRHKNMGMG